jgi:hypothetical protein
MLVQDEIFVEKCCSRCDRISWDSMVGNYNEVCTKKGRLGAILRCDIVGRRMETDGEGNVRSFDKDGNEITTVVLNAEDQRTGSDD